MIVFHDHRTNGVDEPDHIGQAPLTVRRKRNKPGHRFEILVRFLPPRRRGPIVMGMLIIVMAAAAAVALTLVR